MSLTRWDPFGEMTSLRQAMDRLFDESVVRFWEPGGGGDTVPLDVIERDDALVVKASLPGMKPEDVDISIHRNVLSIQGEMQGEEESGGRVHRRERWYGRFSREMTLPVEVNPDACDARFEDGVLTITLPKSEQARARRIQIRGGEQRAIEGETKPAGNGTKEPEPTGSQARAG